MKAKDHFIDPEIEKQRNRLRRDASFLEMKELGAGNKRVREKKVGDLARTALSPKRQGALLASIVRYMQCVTVVELGTSLGISTSYLAKAAAPHKVYSLEGSPTVLACAKETFASLKIENVESRLGHFDDTLPEVLQELETVDFVFFDGNHRKEPTLRYYEMCKAKANACSVFVFHDIYWSKEMAMAWKTILQREEVTLSLDLFHMGIVFFRDNQPKQHFELHF